MEGAKDSCKDNAVHYFYRWFLCPSFQILLSFLLFSTAMQSRSVESCSNYPGLKRKVYLKLLLIFFKCYFFIDLLLLNFSHFHFLKEKKRWLFCNWHQQTHSFIWSAAVLAIATKVKMTPSSWGLSGHFNETQFIFM